MQPLRIAYVINSMEGGGTCAAIPPVARLLLDAGCEVKILALSLRDGRGVRPIENLGLSVSVYRGREWNQPGALRWLRRQISGDRPDVIWTSLTRATLLGQIVGQLEQIPVVSWQHNAFLKPANRLLLRSRQRRSALWVADSDNVAALTASRLGVEPERLAVWPLFAADADAPRARPWQPGKSVRIGSLGRLHMAKGYDVLIAALVRLRQTESALPRIEVEIAGDGALSDELQQQAREAGLDNVRFVGFAEPRRFLAGLNLYVQPSRREGFCIAAHEAMQAGLPVIASAVGELPSTIQSNVTGLLVPPGEPEALSAALAEVLRDPTQLAAMGDAARQLVLARYGTDSFAARGREIVSRIRALRQRR